MPRKLIITCAVAVAALPTAVLAHYAYNDGYVWEGGGKCLFARAEISHGSGGGYSKTDLRAVKPWQNLAGARIECWVSWSRPPGYLSARNVLMKRSRTGRWAVCISGRWNFNSTNNSRLRKQSFYRTPCGRGTYANSGRARTYHDNGWKRGKMWSGTHYLPAR